jgi:hypothetical protein
MAMGLSIRMLGEFYFAQYKEMERKEYRVGQLKNIKLDPIYKIGIKFWGFDGENTNTLSITNEEFNQIKEILLKKDAEKLG